MSFGDLGISETTVRCLNALGITHPFPIQQAAIPDALAGRDILGKGPTGSGKTFTFGLPMIDQLSGSGATRARYPKALILEPTRELAIQVAERLADPAAAHGLRVAAFVGGIAVSKNITALASPIDILVATPGRAQQLLDEGHLRFDEIRLTAIDEADQMADMGFLPQVRRLMDRVPPGQRMLFSATLDGDVDELVRRYLSHPVTHNTAPSNGAGVDGMTHYQVLVGDKTNRTIISQMIGLRDERTIMFTRTRYGVDAQVRRLKKVGIQAAGIHGDKGQTTRQNVIKSFAEGTTPVLVATDIAARGIDIAEVSLVVHVDPPVEHKAYLHRAGRTARGGAEGTVVTLVTREQEHEVAKLLKAAGIFATRIDATTNPQQLKTLLGAKDIPARQTPQTTGRPSGARRRRRGSAKK